jgi:predicted regulator of Ras-like GTPase activity (Roadblock/LC7/MglB family)
MAGRPTAADSDVLPMRRRGSTLSAVAPATAQPPSGTDQDAVTKALHEIRGGIDPVSINGVLVATRDGLVLSAITRGIENDGVAAMAAATAGLSSQFTTQAKIGGPRAVFFEGEIGQVGVFPVDTDALLVVFGERDTTMGMFNVAAKQALTLLQQALASHR